MADSFSNKKRVRLINVNLNGMAYDFFEEILSDAPERIPGLLDLVHELTITLPDGYEIQVRL
jgi:hypothetical protein